MITVERIQELSRLLFLAAALTLAPQVVLAHGGHDHDGRPVSRQSIPAPAPDAKREATDAPVAPALSKSCPGGSGGQCCCAKTAASIGGHTIPVVTAGGWSRPVPAGQCAPAFAEAPLLSSQTAFSPALPRAPPQSS